MGDQSASTRFPAGAGRQVKTVYGPDTGWLRAGHTPACNRRAQLSESTTADSDEAWADPDICRHRRAGAQHDFRVSASGPDLRLRTRATL